MKKLWLIIAALLLCVRAIAAALPYDVNANARADVSRALSQARIAGKDVLLVFGANWCPECRRLDPRIHDNSGKLGDNKYVIVKVDVGNFDKNIDLARSYGNPIKKGIPGAVILTSDNRTLYAGPLLNLLEPHRRLVKIAIAAAVALGALLTLASGIAALWRRRRISSPGGSS